MPVELTILMPCLNEAETLALCIAKARSFLQRTGIEGEIPIADGSTDGSQVVARNQGARVVEIAARGYGAALIGGIASAHGRFVIMGDADNSYDFSRLDAFVAQLRGGAELVMGNRFSGGIAPGAMPGLHRYLGNPVLSGIGRLFFSSPVRDFHCGLRGFDRAAIIALGLQARGMEFASEMVVKATSHRLKMVKFPPHSSQTAAAAAAPAAVGVTVGSTLPVSCCFFRHAGCSLHPGLALTLVGLLSMVWLAPEQRQVGSVVLGIHTFLYSGVATVLGVQATSFAVFATVFAIQVGLRPSDARITWLTGQVTFERGLIWGVLLVLVGFTGSAYALFQWGSADFGPLGPRTNDARRHSLCHRGAGGFSGFFGGFLCEHVAACPASSRLTVAIDYFHWAIPGPSAKSLRLACP